MSPTAEKLPLLDILLTLLVLLSVGLLGIQGQSTSLSASLCVFLSILRNNSDQPAAPVGTL